MDDKTIGIYDTGAAGFAAEWEDEQDPPDDLRAAVDAYFRPGATVDIGCGSGRDSAWLNAQGFDVVGIDASRGLIEEASRRHPGVKFECDTLPGLESLDIGAYANVLCETVIMHMREVEALASVRRLAALLAPGGALYLSWRITEGIDRRDDQGRLYASFETDAVKTALAGYAIELDERIVSASSRKTVHRLVARREDLEFRDPRQDLFTEQC